MNELAGKIKKTPLVSIICIAYNHENYIAQAIEGFLIQKTNFQFEIIISDDASTDRTAFIVHQYEEKYPELFIPFYHKENQFSKGVQFIINELFANAMGKYIALCEGDDYWTDPYKLQKQVDFLEGNPKYSAIGHQSERIYENHPGKSELFFNYSKDTLSKKEIIQSNVFHTNAIVFRKDALLKYDLRNLKSLIEHALFILVAQSGKFYILPDIMSVYRRHDDGAAGTSTPEKAYPGQILWITDIREILGRRFFWGYHFLSSRVHLYYAINHPKVFSEGLFKRNLYFLKFATLTLLLYPRNMKTVFRLIPKLLGSR